MWKILYIILDIQLGQVFWKLDWSIKFYRYFTKFCKFLDYWLDCSSIIFKNFLLSWHKIIESHKFIIFHNELFRPSLLWVIYSIINLVDHTDIICLAEIVSFLILWIIFVHVNKRGAVISLSTRITTWTNDCHWNIFLLLVITNNVSDKTPFVTKWIAELRAEVIKCLGQIFIFSDFPKSLFNFFAIIHVQKHILLVYKTSRILKRCSNYVGCVRI